MRFFAAGLVIFAVVGCSDESQVARLGETLSLTRAELADLAAEIEALPASSDKEELLGKIRALELGFARAEERLQAMGRTIDSEDLARAAVGFLPPPWNVIGASAISLLVGGFAAWKRKQAELKAQRAVAGKIIQGIDLVKSPEGVVNFSDPRTVQILDQVMGKEGKALVDENQH